MTQRTFASDFAIQLGLFSLNVDVVPVRRPNSRESVSFKQICPECEGAEQVLQQYVCPNGHGPFVPAQLHKARKTDEGLRRMSAEEMEFVAKGDAPSIEGVLDLHVCPRSDLESATRPGENAYRLRLGKKSRQGDRYNLLKSLVSSPDVALYGVAKLNGRVPPTPFRLDLWNGQIVLQSLVRPQDLAETDELPEIEVDDLLKAMGEQLLAASMASFSADLLADERIARLESVVRAGEPEITRLPESTDLMAMLEQSLARVS